MTPIRPSSWYRVRQLLLPLASLAVVFVLFATMAVSVSASAIPGDALYSVKRLVENVRLNQTGDPETAVTLMEQYQQERIREVQTLLRTGRSAEVTFDGEIEAIQPDSWMVATIDVMLDAGTSIEGKPQVGEMARVNGRTAEGRLIASLIEVLTSSAATPEPEPTPEPTTTSEPTATATFAPTTQPPETPTAEPTATQTVTPTPQPTATITPTPTATPSPQPTPPPDNDNDNDGGGNENDNDNGNDNDDNDNDDNDNDDDDDGDSSGSGSNGNDNGDDNDNDNDDDDDD